MQHIPSFCHIDYETKLKNQFKQKLKLMVKDPGYLIYSNKKIIYSFHKNNNFSKKSCDTIKRKLNNKE